MPYDLRHEGREYVLRSIIYLRMNITFKPHDRS